MIALRYMPATMPIIDFIKIGLISIIS